MILKSSRRLPRTSSLRIELIPTIVCAVVIPASIGMSVSGGLPLLPLTAPRTHPAPWRLSQLSAAFLDWGKDTPQSASRPSLPLRDRLPAQNAQSLANVGDCGPNCEYCRHDAGPHRLQMHHLEHYPTQHEHLGHRAHFARPMG